MRIALLGRNKLGFVNGSWKKESFSIELGNQWEKVNAIVLSWIINSVSSNLVAGIVYASNASGVWLDLQERFNKIDGSRTFNLHQEIAFITQGVQSVSVYYSKLKALWDEFESMVPYLACGCEISRDFVLYLQRLKLY